MSVTPEELLLGLVAPAATTQLTTGPNQPLYFDCRPVVVQKSRVVHIRPVLAPGWQLTFTVEVFDNEVPFETVQEVLRLAGFQLPHGSLVRLDELRQTLKRVCALVPQLRDMHLMSARHLREGLLFFQHFQHNVGFLLWAISSVK